MIKPAILGGASPIGGELIRILINHPEVEITSVWQPDLSGRKVADIVHGLVGERNLTFTESTDTGNANMAFLISDLPEARAMAEAIAQGGGKVIDMSASGYARFNLADSTLGLSEIYRKTLVRGETRCVMPRPLETITLISLYPLALNLLVNHSIDISVNAPADVSAQEQTARGCAVMEQVLSDVQSSFVHTVSCRIAEATSSRCARVSTDLRCAIPLPDVMELYDKVYDDHNFTYFDTKPYHFKEVEGTNKCLITLTKPDDCTLRVEAICDARMRGGAGEAVHAMNLMCGLHEKVGLTFKSSVY